MKLLSVLLFIVFSLQMFCSVEQDSLVLFKKLKQASNPQQKLQANIALAKFYLSRSLTTASTYVNAAKSIAQKIMIRRA